MKKYEVLGNTAYDHCFKKGQIVTLVRKHSKRVVTVKGMYYGYVVEQDLNVRDLKLIKEEQQ